MEQVHHSDRQIFFRTRFTITIVQGDTTSLSWPRIGIMPQVSQNRRESLFHEGKKRFEYHNTKKKLLHYPHLGKHEMDLNIPFLIFLEYYNILNFVLTGRMEELLKKESVPLKCDGQHSSCGHGE